MAALNPRLAAVRESATLAINQKAKAMRASGADIAHFGFGESPFPVHSKLIAALANNARQKSYLPGLGLPALRENIAAFYEKHAGYHFDSKRIAVGPGSKELIFDLLYLLQGPLILPAPCWVSYAPQAALLNKEVVFAPADSSLKLSPAALSAALDKADAAQSILILNSPNNPTGQVFADKELEEIAKVCRARDVIVIADEIYAQTDYAKSLSAGIGAHCPERVIVTGGLSKAYSAGGWRVGFAAACDENLQEVFDALATVISETFSCVCAPAQSAACVAYSDDEEINQYVRDCARIHGAIVNFAAAELRKGGLRCLDAGGGFYLFPDFDSFAAKLKARNINSAAQLAECLLSEARVAALPGEDFSVRDSYALRLAMVDYDGAEVYRAYQSGGEEEILKNAAALMPFIVAGCKRIGEWAAAL
jgi:aspartate/methionine/tyrosine aminotransferase